MVDIFVCTIINIVLFKGFFEPLIYWLETIMYGVPLGLSLCQQAHVMP